MSDDRHAAAEPPLLEQFLNTNATWRWRAWVFFAVTLCFCTVQAVPGWSHPSLHLNWDPTIWYAVIGAAGALAGPAVARYRLAGMLAGATAGVGSVLTAVLVLGQIHPFSRVVLVAVGVTGLLPGVPLYLLLHLAADRLTSAPRP